jgi:hypothetical protein
MRNKILLLIFGLSSIHCGFSQVEQLSGTTIGFSTGIGVLNGKLYDYSLDPGSNNLVIQRLSNASFIISSTLTIKFARLSTQVQGTGNARKKVFVRSGDIKTDETGALQFDEKNQPLLEHASLRERLAFNIGLNLAEINSGNISFNKPIDGGLGLGYFVTPSVQAAIFIDIIRARQMRKYIVNSYENKPIPKGSDFYNALDQNDNNLFYNKTFTGFSFKVIIALNPVKPEG